MATSTQPMSSPPRSGTPPPCFLTLTFYGKYSIIVNTNASYEELVVEALKTINDALGPFKTISNTQNCGEHRSSFIMRHAQGAPFHAKNGSGEALKSVCVKMCALFNALNAAGWRPESKCNLDSKGRRSCIVFRYAPHTGCPDTSYACVTLPKHRDASKPDSILTVAPIWAEEDLSGRLRERARSETLHPVGDTVTRQLYRVFLPVTDTYAAAEHQVRHFQLSRWREFNQTMGLVLAAVGSMKDIGFDLEASFNPFGGDQLDMLMFAHYSHPRRPNCQFWAMSVRQPNCLVGVRCPPQVENLVRQHRSSEPLWNYRFVNATNDGHVLFGWRAESGKQVMCSLLRRLEQKDWWVIGSFDGLYKNSFMIFGRSEVRQSEMLSPSALPWTIALSVATTKKIRFDDASCLLRKTIDEPYNENTIDALTPLYAIGKPTKRKELCVREVHPNVLGCRSEFNVSKEVDVFLKLIIAYDGLGYVSLCGANVQGRHFEEEQPAYGPHTWFLVKRPKLSQPPEFEAVEGLPTYEEAMRQLRRERRRRDAVDSNEPISDDSDSTIEEETNYAILSDASEESVSEKVSSEIRESPASDVSDSN